MIVVCLLFCLLLNESLSQGLPQLQPITADNVAGLQEIGRLGRGTANALDWHPDGTRLAIGSAKGVWLLDDTLQRIERTPVEQPVTALAWSPDDSLIAVTGGEPELCVTQIWAADFSERRFANDFCGSAVQWSPNSTQLAVFGTWDINQVQLIDIAKEETTILPGQDGTWSPSGEVLFTRLLTTMYYPEQSKLYRWDTDSGQQLSLLEQSNWEQLGGEILYGLDDDAFVVSCSRTDEATSVTHVELCRFDTRIGKMESVQSIDSFPEGRCACLSYPARNEEVSLLAYVYGVSTPGFLNSVRAYHDDGHMIHVGNGEAFDWKPGADVLTIIVGNGAIRTHDVATSEIISESKFFNAHVSAISVKPDNAEIASTAFGYEQDTLIWDINVSPFDPIHRFHIEPAGTIAYTPSGRELIAGGTIYTDIMVNRKISAFDPNTGEFIRDIEAFYGQGIAPVRRYWNADYSMYAEADKQGVLTLPNGIAIQPENIFEYAAFSLDGTMIATIERYPDDYSFDTHVWSTTTGEHINRLWRDMFGFEALVWSPDGTQIAVSVEHPTGSNIYVRGVNVFGLDDMYANWWERSIFADVDSYKTNEQAVVAWNSDGTLLAVTLPGRLSIYPLDTDMPLMTLPVFGTTSLEWSTDDRFIAAGNEDGTIRLWGVPSR